MTGITKRLLLISSASADPNIINDDLVARESIKFSSGDFLTELDEHYDKSISSYCGLQNEVDLIPQYLAQEDVSVISIDSSQESLRGKISEINTHVIATRSLRVDSNKDFMISGTLNQGSERSSHMVTPPIYKYLGQSFYESV